MAHTYHRMNSSTSQSQDSIQSWSVAVHSFMSIKMPNDTQQERQEQSLFDLGSSFLVLESVISEYKVSRLLSESNIHPGPSFHPHPLKIHGKSSLFNGNISQAIMQFIYTLSSLSQVKGVKFCSVNVVFLIRSFKMCT